VKHDGRPSHFVSHEAGFPPIIDETSRVLVLGTLPSEESLRRQEYYGHPRNQFWRILADIYHVPLAETYPDVSLYCAKAAALWMCCTTASVMAVWIRRFGMRCQMISENCSGLPESAGDHLQRPAGA